jgi:hypothetical protein
MKTRTARSPRSKRLALVPYLALSFGTCLAPAASAQDWVPRFDAYTGASGSQLGSSMATRILFGDGPTRVSRIYVGAPFEDKDALVDAGAVRIYNPSPDGWQLVATLYSNAPQAGAHFGATLDESGSNLAVAAPDFASNGGSSPGAGRVEFYIDNGQPTPGLSLRLALPGAAGQHLGRALALDGNMAALGYIPSNGSGCVATYRYNTSIQQWQALPATDNFVCGGIGAEFGASLAIRRTGDETFVLVAGAPGETRNGNALAGAAHVYAPNPDAGAGGLLEIGTLVAQDPQFLDVFGTSVGIDADYAYVGATGRDNGAGRVGSVTIFKPGFPFGYDLLNEYFPGAPATIGGHCGASLSVDQFSDQFVVGCPDSNGSVAQEGNARLFRKTIFLGQPVWFESLLGFADLPHGADRLGSSLAVFQDQVFVGAPRTDVPPVGLDHGGWWEFVSNDVIFADGFQ